MVSIALDFFEDVVILFFIQDVESLGRKMGFTADKQSFHNVSLGQGQEVVAEEAMEIGAKNGHWVVLQVKLCLKFSQR